jgi:hypothetical protein
VIESALHSHWIFALPMPIFFALSGTLVYVWFSRYAESAAIGANFLVSAIVLIPATFLLSQREGAVRLDEASIVPILLLLVDTLASSAAGRVFYQHPLSATHNDNGFVTMFFSRNTSPFRAGVLAIVRLDQRLEIWTVAAVLCGHGPDCRAVVRVLARVLAR